jgi:hypothetical protein
MTGDRDVQAFEERAPGYEGGYLSRLHQEIAVRTADLALARFGQPAHVLASHPAAGGNRVRVHHVVPPLRRDHQDRDGGRGAGQRLTACKV